MKYQETTKVEFLLMCNDNIVVQRFFKVEGINKNSYKSEELHDYIRIFTDELKYNLKMRSVVYMLDNQYDITENPDMLNTSITDGSENFNIYIKVGDTTIYHRRFDAKLYPPKIRYTVDLRPKLKGMLTDLTNILSSVKFNFY